MMSTKGITLFLCLLLLALATSVNGGQGTRRSRMTRALHGGRPSARYDAPYCSEEELQACDCSHNPVRDACLCQYDPAGSPACECFCVEPWRR
uniref:Conotoxin Cal22f n=1 Tax=Californiconus californicus TaxID=1736779 RepID=CUMF_CONCL